MKSPVRNNLLPAGIHLGPFEARLLGDPWYHNFQPLGFPTAQKGSSYVLNQQSKQQGIFSLIDEAATYCREQGIQNIRGVDLACADGFYTNYAAQHGIDYMEGVDINKVDLAKARLITKILGNPHKTTFLFGDVFRLSDTYDLGVCAGLLYHLSNPKELLTTLVSHVNSVLIVQSIISLRSESADYFVTPAPTRSWGSRFSYAYLLRIVTESGWSILTSKRGEVLGNPKLDDRGSAYILCVNEAKRKIH